MKRRKTGRFVAIAAALLWLAGGSPELARAAAAGEDREGEHPDHRFFQEFHLQSPKAAPSIVKVDREDNVWFAMARAGKIGRFRGGQIREYELPPNAFPVGLALDNSGQVWFSDIRRNKICRLDPATGAVREFDVPTANSWPFYIVLGHDGRFYFTERMGNNIGRLDPVSGEIVEFPVPTANASPAGMAVTPDGAIFFTENSGNKVGRLDPVSGEISEFPVPTPMTPSPFYGLAGIAADAEGNLWFAEVDGRLGLLRRGEGTIDEIPISNPTGRPAGVAVDVHGLIWFTELDGNAITSYNPRLGEFRRYLIPTGAPDRRPKGPPEVTARGELPVPGFMARTSRPFGIAVDSRGRVWFSEQYGHKLGVLTPPAAEIFAPRGIVRGGAATALAVQIRAEVPAARVRYLLDGLEVPRADRLELAWRPPGRREFAVEVVAPDGRLSRSAVRFDFRPDLETVAEVVRRAAATGEISGAVHRRLADWVDRARDHWMAGDTVAGRTALRELMTGLSQTAEDLPRGEGLRRLLLSHLRHIDLFGERRYPVRVVDESPYFIPRRLTVEVGDSVVWSYAKTAGGRPAIEISGPETPFVTTDPAAGGVAHTFHREGEYRFASAASPGDALSVVVTARTAHMLELPLPSPDRVPGVLAVDGEDNVWFTAGGGGFLNLGEVLLNNKIGRIAADGTIREYETPTPESGPTSIAVAPDGKVWFTERGANQVGVLDPVSEQIREFPIPTPMSTPTGITVAPDGRVWYAAKHASRVGVLDPATGDIVEYETPTPASEPSTITADDEGYVWFDERANDKIVRLDPESGDMREFHVPTRGSRVVGLVPDGRGHVWFLELGGNKVGRLHTESAAVVEYAIPTPRSAPFKLAVDRSGRVWFTEVFGNRIGVLDGGRFYELALPAEGSMPGGITIDSQGNVWFTEQAGNRIGMIPRGAAPWEDEAAAPEGEWAGRSYLLSSGAGWRPGVAREER